MISVGDKVTHYIEALSCKRTGTVIWVHPEHRFYRVEFVFKNTRFTESFPILDRSRIAKEYGTRTIRNGVEY